MASEGYGHSNANIIIKELQDSSAESATITVYETMPKLKIKGLSETLGVVVEEACLLIQATLFMTAVACSAETRCLVLPLL
jgi:hypothetical protein